MTEDNTFDHLKYRVNVSNDGVKTYRNSEGFLHREDGPAYINPNGYKAWWLNGQRHREDGPAVIMKNGYRAWLLNGDYHREDGPARMWPDGSWQTFRYGVCIGQS